MAEEEKYAAVVAALAVALSPAAVAGADDDFDAFISGAVSDFDSFIDEANRAFIDFMRKPWEKHTAAKPVEKRAVPEPVTPPAVPAAGQDTTAVKPYRLIIEEILGATTSESGNVPVAGATPDIPVDVASSKPAASKPRPSSTVAPKPQPAKPTAPAVKSAPKPAAAPALPLQTAESGKVAVSLGGITYYVDGSLKGAIRLASLDEKAIADAWEKLLRADYAPLVADLQKLRAGALGGDWALFLVVKQAAESLAGKNESMVLRQFLLNQLGYRARIARVPAENRLALFVAPDCQLYGVVYVDLGGARYYDVDARKPYSFLMCGKDAPSATRKVGMSMAVAPKLGKERKATTHTSPVTKVSVTASVPPALVEFYSRVPQCDYSVYATAAVEPTFERELLGALRPAIEGLDEKQAAGLLLNWVQHGFDYATDGQQFGIEKPFFVEELFYWPQCDCEDRSMLYRYLVKKLLGLDVVLVDYPNHIATAVKFGKPVEGDYLMVDGERYVVCDPTYIGAGVGRAMPQFRSTPGKVLKY